MPDIYFMQDKYAKYARQLTGEWEENTGISVSIFLGQSYLFTYLFYLL